MQLTGDELTASSSVVAALAIVGGYPGRPVGEPERTERSPKKQRLAAQRRARRTQEGNLRTLHRRIERRAGGIHRPLRDSGAGR